MTDERATIDQQNEEQAAAGVLPVLAGLDATVAELEDTDQAPTELIDSYEQQAAHARHLISTTGVSRTAIAAAERHHRGDGERGFAKRAYGHAMHPQHHEPAPDSRPSDRSRDDEEIDL